MKKLYVLLIPFFALLLFFGTALSVNAEGSEVYVIKKGETSYVLSYLGEIIGESEKPEELFGFLPSGACVELDSVVFSGELSLFRNMTVKGSFSTASPITVKGGAVITFTDITVSLTDGGILEITDGRVHMTSGLLTHTDGTVVRLGGLSSSLFTMTGGRVSTRSASCAIDILDGSAELLGGYVDNTAGVAVNAEGTVTVGGSVTFDSAIYDIISSREVCISRTSPFGGTLSLKLLDEFQKGGAYPVVLGANESCIGRISVFDIHGAECELDYFNGGGEGYLAVYRPFFVKYVASGEVVFTDEVLSGDVPTDRPLPTREGYTPVAWCSDSTLREKYNFAQGLSSDVTLYASYSLSEPEFSLLSVSTVYDGLEHCIEFTELSHPKESDGFYSFLWESESGEVVSYTDSLPYREVANSGRYRCIITFTLGRDSVTAVTPYITLLVEKQSVTPPRPESLVYNGESLIPAIERSELYQAELESFVNAGEYLIPITLTDPDNYTWCGTDEETVYVSFTVERAENSWVRVPKDTWVYYGQAYMPVGVARFGEVKYKYKPAGSDEYVTDIPTDIGIYQVVAEVSESENYTGLQGEPFSLEIREDRPVALSVLTPPKTCEYRAFDLFCREGLSFTVTYESGEKRTLEGEAVSVYYQSDMCLRFGDNAVIAEYRGVRVSVPLTVTKREYDVTLDASDEETVYDGRYKSYTFDVQLPTGLDGIPLYATVTGGGTDSGEYGVVISFSSESEDYSLPSSLYPKLIIRPMPVTVVWDRTEFMYSGSVVCPRAKFTDAFGASVSLAVSGGAIMAGEGYIASAITKNANYTLQNSTVEYRINKSELDLSGVYLSSDSFVYDGTVKSVTLEGLPLGVRVIGYTDNRGREVGEYTLSASLSYDSANYNCPEHISMLWRIERAPYDTTGFSFVGGEFIYDGAPHFPTLEGEMPIGIDGIPLSFKFGEGVTNVLGSSVVEVVFTTESPNYYPPAKIYVPVSITPRGYSVIWCDTDFLYSGGVYQPTAIAEHPTEVIGSASEAGEYTARAVSLDANYFVINSDVTYRINKRNNSLISPLAVNDVFVGTSPSPFAECEFGVPEFLYYRDSDFTVRVTPDSPGVYYVRAYVPESANYLPFYSPAVSFSVISIVPVRLDITMLRSSYTAFELVSPEDFSALLTCNDGSTRELDTQEVCVIYRDGSSLLAGDGGVTFTAFGVGTSAPVTVGRAVYDMSGATWSNTTCIYSGETQYPSLTGLPEGVSLLSLQGSGCNAGQYTVTAVLSYDERNYEPPELSPVSFKIEKQKITPTLSGNLVYNGEAQLPLSPTTLYHVVEEGVFRDTGSYLARLALTDPLNYEFEGSELVSFEILPLELTLILSSEDVYLFDEPTGNGYAVTDGTVYPGDDLMISYSVIDGKLFATSGNRNYKINVIPGDINYLSRPSPAVTRALFFCFLIALLLTLLLIYLSRRRDDIRGLLLSVKERYLAAPVPIAELPTPAQIPEGGVDATRADGLISDGIAKTLLRKEGKKIYTAGRRRVIVNIDTLSENFAPSDIIDINILKSRGIIPHDAGYIKVLARGAVDKPLTVYANSFSLSAVKMIALTGGEANKVTTGREKRETEQKKH